MKYNKGERVLIEVDCLIEDSDYTVAKERWRGLDVVKGKIVEEYNDMGYGDREKDWYVVQISYRENGFDRPHTEFAIKLPEDYLSIRCNSCKSRKVYHDKKESYFCPFCL